LFDLLNSIS